MTNPDMPGLEEAIEAAHTVDDEAAIRLAYPIIERAVREQERKILIRVVTDLGRKEMREVLDLLKESGLDD